MPSRLSSSVSRDSLFRARQLLDESGEMNLETYKILNALWQSIHDFEVETLIILEDMAMMGGMPGKSVSMADFEKMIASTKPPVKSTKVVDDKFPSPPRGYL